LSTNSRKQKLLLKSQRLKPYTFAIRYCQQHKPKIAKEYVFANAINRTEKKASGQQCIKIIAVLVLNSKEVSLHKV